MRTFLVTLLGLVLVAATAVAEETCRTEETDVDTGETPVGRYYVVNDECQPECLFSVWVYEESNGQDGLQRCDDGIPESCMGCTRDSIIF